MTTSTDPRVKAVREKLGEIIDRSLVQPVNATEAAIELLAAADEANGWQPFETAPRPNVKFQIWVRAKHNRHEFHGGNACWHDWTGDGSLVLMCDTAGLNLDPEGFYFLFWRPMPPEPRARPAKDAKP